MKKTFMWYYTFIWLTIGMLVNLLGFLDTGNGDSFWAVAIVVPTLVWLYKVSKK